jgi:hypothetical protein
MNKSLLAITECPIVFIAITPKSQIPNGFPSSRATISPKTIGLNNKSGVIFQGIQFNYRPALVVALKYIHPRPRIRGVTVGMNESLG